MHYIFIILAFYGMSFLIKEASIFDKPRIFLIQKSVFFYKLLSCYFCVGFHSGYIIYFIYSSMYNFDNFRIGELLIWSLSAASSSLILDLVVSKLSK